MVFSFRLNNKHEYLPIVLHSDIRTRIKELWVRFSCLQCDVTLNFFLAYQHDFDNSTP